MDAVVLLKCSCTLKIGAIVYSETLVNQISLKHWYNLNTEESGSLETLVPIYPTILSHRSEDRHLRILRRENFQISQRDMSRRHPGCMSRALLHHRMLICKDCTGGSVDGQVAW
jgi:hypothetical protein